MAQTKRKRRTKHRGTPVGTIEARGRTGRKPTSAERSGSKQDPKDARRERRLARLEQPPTWRGAANRAAIATVVLVVTLILIFKQQPGRAIALAGFALIIYIPLGYYTDLVIYRRRLGKKQQAANGAKKAKDEK
jgi:hypothetical protein